MLSYVGVGLFTSFCVGQLSGMVEPVAGVIGSSAVQVRFAMVDYTLLAVLWCLVLPLTGLVTGDGYHGRPWNPFYRTPWPSLLERWSSLSSTT